jgi:hypothetical protein
MRNGGWKLANMALGFVFIGASVATAGTASASSAGNNTGENAAATAIPAGTILPVTLDSSVSFEKSKAGQIVRGKIAQGVTLSNGQKIPKGAKVEGTIVEVGPNGNGSGARLALKFDKVFVAGQWVPVVTDLRAIAGFVAVQRASIPNEAPNEGTPYVWLPTTQIGGDTVYGLGGQVANAQNETVGTSERDGVVGRVSAKEGEKCRGEINGNNSAQSLWVFSSDACGTYGIKDLTIEHAGRTEPMGQIVLVAENPKVKLREGDGLLLRSN